MRLVFLGIMMSLLLVVGCSTDSGMSSMMGPQQSDFALIPFDGQTEVRLDAGISLAFAEPVDRSVVERNFHLIGEQELVDSLCPIDPMMNHGMMSTAMMDSTLMRHLIEQHYTLGRFSWQDDGMACTFRPDSHLAPGTQYMIHLGGEMMRMMRERMGNMGMMGGHRGMTTQDDMAFHFFTVGY